MLSISVDDKHHNDKAKCFNSIPSLKLLTQVSGHWFCYKTRSKNESSGNLQNNQPPSLSFLLFSQPKNIKRPYHLLVLIFLCHLLLFCAYGGNFQEMCLCQNMLCVTNSKTWLGSDRSKLFNIHATIWPKMKISQ